MIIPFTGMLFQGAFLSHVKTASFRSLLSFFFNFFWLEFRCFKDFFLLIAIHVEMVFFFTPYSSATLLFVPFSPSIFCKTLNYFVIKVITLFIFHICSGALCCLWKIRILLLITFEFWFVWIFLKFLREDIALLTLQKIVLLVLSQRLKRKTGFVEKLLTPMNKELPKVTINNFETISNVKGYHVY